MSLEQQLDKLAELDLTLNDGITIDDLLYSFGREAYEEEPFDLILFMLGAEVEREPWGRSICSRVWNFDTECINETGDYVAIVKRLCEVANNPNLITDIEDFVDIESGKAWLKYTVDGTERDWVVEVFITETRSMLVILHRELGPDFELVDESNKLVSE